MKKLYICKRNVEQKVNYGISITTYGTPKEYHMLYMPVSSQVDYQLYGELIKSMQCAFVRQKPMRGKFKKGDKCYLYDNEMQDIEIALTDRNCENANYEIYSVDEQLLYTKIIFKKIK